MDSTQILRRVGNALLVFCAFHVAGAIADFVTSSSHSISIDLTALVLGLCLRNGSLGAARWTAFLFTLQLVTIGGGVLILPIVGWMARDQLSGLMTLGVAWGVLMTAAEAIFAWWVLRELGDPTVEAALAGAQRGSIRRASRWGVGVGVGLLVITSAVGLVCYSLWPRWTAPAVAAAQAQLGPGWEISVRTINSSSSGWRAHVVARRGGEIKELDVHSP